MLTQINRNGHKLSEAMRNNLNPVNYMIAKENHSQELACISGEVQMELTAGLGWVKIHSERRNLGLPIDHISIWDLTQMKGWRNQVLLAHATGITSSEELKEEQVRGIPMSKINTTQLIDLLQDPGPLWDCSAETQILTVYLFHMHYTPLPWQPSQWGSRCTCTVVQ